MYPIDFYSSQSPDENLEQLTSVSPDIDLAELTRIMTEDFEERVAVVDNSKIVGVVTRRGLLKAFAGKPPTGLSSDKM
jgi:CBS domain-containing protein